MSEYVEQCRREWKRLRVPDDAAEEMAADLTTDLEEAAAEGVSAEALLGDPQAFARSWAAERGIIPAPSGRRARRRPVVLVAFTAVAALAVIVAALLLATGQPKVALVAAGPHPALPSASAGAPVRRVLVQASAAAPIEWIMLVLAVIALGFAAWLWTGWGRSRPPGVPA